MESENIDPRTRAELDKTTFELAGHRFPRVTWYKNSGMRKTYLVLMCVVLTSATNGYDGSMMNNLQILDWWQDYFNNPHGSLLGLFNGIMSIGGLVALPIVPYAADVLGRRWGIAVGCFICLIGVVLQSWAANFAMFIIARFILGFGIAIAHGSSPLLITELAHTQHRAIFTTIYNTCWYAGSIVAAWLTFGTVYIESNWSWRIPSIVQGVPSLIQLLFVWFVPESPRWHIGKGRPEIALKILADCHANGDVNDEVVMLEMHEIEETIRMEKEAEANGWAELFRTKGNRRRLIILFSAGLFSQWSGNGLVSYYLNLILDGVGITNSTTQTLINGILQICNYAVALIMSFYVDKFGRRKLFLTSTAGMLVTFIIWTICSAVNAENGSAAAGRGVIVMIFIYYICYNIAWSGLLVGYSVEILPFSIRAKGMIAMFLAVDIALFFNQYINPIALDALDWKYYIFYVCWIAFELVFVWYFYVETMNTPLEEIARHFDGEDAIIGGATATKRVRKIAGESSMEKDAASTGVEVTQKEEV